MKYKRVLNEAQGKTFNELVGNSERVTQTVLSKTDPYTYRFENLKVVPMAGLKYVEYDTTTYNKDSGNHYLTSMFFYNVDVKTGEKPNLNSSPVRVYCSCKSYYFYWWYANKLSGCHARRPLKAYVRKTPPPPEGRDYKNPQNLAGMCKHLIAFGNYLNQDDYMYSDPNITKLIKPAEGDVNAN
jgi:hypothetical protein